MRTARAQTLLCTCVPDLHRYQFFFRSLLNLNYSRWVSFKSNLYIKNHKKRGDDVIIKKLSRNLHKIRRRNVTDATEHFIDHITSLIGGSHPFVHALPSRSHRLCNRLLPSEISSIIRSIRNSLIADHIATSVYSTHTAAYLLASTETIIASTSNFSAKIFIVNRSMGPAASTEQTMQLQQHFIYRIRNGANNIVVAHVHTKIINKITKRD